MPAARSHAMKSAGRRCIEVCDVALDINMLAEDDGAKCCTRDIVHEGHSCLITVRMGLNMLSIVWGAATSLVLE